MSFSAEFMDMCESQELHPLYLVESIGVAQFSPNSNDLKLSSFETGDRSYNNVISVDGSSISYGSLRPQSWGTTAGTWSIGLARQDPTRYRTMRGQMVRLRIGFPGWDLNQFQTVALGTVSNIARSGDEWTLQVTGLEASLWSRFASSENEHLMFSGLPSTTVSTINPYFAGDPTLVVSSSAGFEREYGGRYLILVTPGSGSPFYLSATSLAGNTFSVPGVAAFGTTAVNAGLGSKAESIAYINDHPLDIVASILLSTGVTGAHGGADKLPKTWAFGLTPETVDEGDIAWNRTKTKPATGSYNWEFFRKEVEDFASELSSFVAPGGYFLTQRMGKLTARAVLDFDNDGPHETYRVSTRDLIKVEGYTAYSRDAPVQYRRFGVNTRGDSQYGTKNAELYARPSLDIRRVTLSDVWQNDTEIRTEVKNRLYKWYTRLPESVTVEIAGWGSARLALGDGLSFTPNLIVGRHGYGTGALSEGRPGMVIGGGVNWFGATSRYTVLFLPETSTG